MKRLLSLLGILALVSACSQPKENLTETVLDLCQYIPDHGLIEGAEEYMTPDFFNAYSCAFEAPVADYGEIGENDWLYYFVTGNGEAMPAYSVKSVNQTGKETAKAVIAVQQVWGDGIDPDEEVAEYELDLKKIDGKWLLDDFDGKKQECLDYVKDLRERYKTGEIVEYLESQDYTREYVPEFLERLQAFYQKYGE